MLGVVIISGEANVKHPPSLDEFPQINFNKLENCFLKSDQLFISLCVNFYLALTSLRCWQECYNPLKL